MVKINDADFSDIYITPSKKAYIWSGKSPHGLKEITFDDYPEFYSLVEKEFKSNPSYLVVYQKHSYRVERTIALHGVQYCIRKQPQSVPRISDLGMSPQIVRHLISLGRASGLILVAGATGSGKSTTLGALLKEYLINEGGFALTIEDPVELPLDGVYKNSNGELGLCKQTMPQNGKWAESLKSALRSCPRYIMLGEIRSPDIATEALQAAASGHLVLSTIHANSVGDAINALVKYAAASDISEDMAYDLVSTSLLACLQQRLIGIPKRLVLQTLFANPDITKACQVRGAIKLGKLNFSTIIEQQNIKLVNNQPLFGI
ncbi:MAG: Flp pilus assembly complex ATPase component TadA [Alphaproteobacteria bacterium]|nr:Flp pilus assembly complex ATPase component TadA [Alphaproteobacteria bacterium]